MRIYRALLLIIIAVAAAVPAVAQFRYAPIVGININDLKFKQDLFNVDKTSLFR